MPQHKARGTEPPADSPAATPNGAKAPGEGRAGSRFSLAKLIPLGILLAGLVAFFATGLNKYVSFGELAKHHTAMATWVQKNLLLAALCYMAGYAVMIAFSLPGGAVATIFGGFLFAGVVDGIAGTMLAAAIVVVGATLGATALFLAARSGLGEPLRARAGPGLRRMEAGFHENAMSYLLVLRLVPLFPFWLVNLVPAFLGVPLRTYVIGTFFGIMPGTFVYASVGGGLGAILEAGESPDLGIIFKAEILVPLLGLALLALIPVIYKRIKARR
ncbi:MAG TPA: VTT domain-containing protein [Alphaproteobacteria bacterium]|nr:VTT domain-containing protein [Alphaproteobacteria bacterium]